VAEDFQALASSVDTVVCLNVVRARGRRHRRAQEYHSALEPGGRAIILVPSGNELFGSLDVALGHHRRYTGQELQEKMTRVGFRVERVLGFNRMARPGGTSSGKILRRTTLGRFQLRAFDSLVWLWRRIDAHLPWRPVSIIAIAVKPE